MNKSLRSVGVSRRASQISQKTRARRQVLTKRLGNVEQLEQRRLLAGDGLQVVTQTPDGYVSDDISRITLDVSEPIQLGGANDTNSYTLTDLGLDRQIGGGDDQVIPVAPTYLNGTTRIDLLPVLGDSIELANWREFDYTGTGSTGDWRVENDGSSVKQYNNAYPTFYVSDFDFLDREFTGRIKVETTGDDDFIGVAFGVSVDEANNRPNDYYLLNWKQRDQGNAEAGFKLTKVTNSSRSSNATMHDLLWNGENATSGSTRLQVLASHTANNPGWTDNTEYEFSFRYESNGNISVAIRRSSDGAVQWNTSLTDDTPLGAGKVAFFNHSQSLVRYSGLQQSEFLPEGSYQVRLKSGAGAIEDIAGTALDGDPDVDGLEDYIGHFVIDQTAPVVNDVTITSTSLEVEFFDAGGVDPDSAQSTANYELIASGGDGTFDDGNEVTVAINEIAFAALPNTASLSTATGFGDDRYRLTVSNISDRAGFLLADSYQQTLDLLSGPATVSVDLQASSDLGVSSTDELTSDATPTIDVSVNKAGRLDVDYSGDGVADYSELLTLGGVVAITVPALQDGDHTVTATFTPAIGDAVSDSLDIELDTVGPSVLPGTNPEHAPLFGRQITFSEDIDINSILPTDVVMVGPLGNVALTSVSGSGDTFTLGFDPLTTPGEYQISTPVGLTDLAGNLANQDGDGVNGEVGQDEPIDSFTLLPDVDGPYVTEFVPLGLVNEDVSQFEVRFNETIRESTFTANDVVIVGPDGEVDPGLIEVSPAFGDGQSFTVTFPTLSTEGEYNVQIGPAITDLAGNLMEPLVVVDDQSFESSPDGWVFSGSAVWNEGGFVRLTPSTSYAAGSAFFGTPQTPNPFRVDFDFNMNGGAGSSDGDGRGADGMVFVLAELPNQGSTGGGIGYLGYPGTSFGVEFDNYYYNPGDFGADHIGIDWNGVFRNVQVGVPQRLIDTGQWHAAVEFDGTSLLTVNVTSPSGQQTSLAHDLPVEAIPSQYTFGFTAATGSAYANHDIDNVQVRLLPSGAEGGGFRGTFEIDKTGPSVTSLTPSGPLDASISQIDVQFDEAILSSSLSADDVTIVGPDGTVAVGVPVNLGDNRFRFSLPTQSNIGVYNVTIGPEISDTAGNLMDQNRDGENGGQFDMFVGGFEIVGTDILPQSVEGPGYALPGNPATVSWQTANVASIEAAGSWREKVFLVLGSQEVLLGSFDYSDQAISGGEFLQRSEQVNLPANLDPGEWRFRVDVDVNDTLVETDNTNNSALADALTILPVTFSLSTTSSSVREDAAPFPVRLTRSGDAGLPLEVRLSSDDETELTVPSTVTIPAGQLWVEFLATPVQDSTADGDRVATISAEILDLEGNPVLGFSPDTHSITVVDTALPALTLSLSSSEVSEGGSVLATVNRDTSVNADPMLVTLLVSDDDQLSVPISVSIGMGQSSATFDVQALSDELVEIDRAYTVTARGFGEDTETLLVRDVNRKDLALTTDVSIAENAVRPAIGRVTRPVVSNLPQVVQLRSSDASRLQVPSRVTIPANGAYVEFAITTLDNLVQGDSLDVQISALAIDAVDGVTPVPPGGSANILVQDNDSPTLTVTIDRGLISENAPDPAATGNVRRNTADNSDPLTVYLFSSDTTEATVATEVTIEAGKAAAEFDILAVDDFTPDGLQFVTISAETTGFNSGSARLVVSDVDKPDFRITDITPPAGALTDRTIDLVYTLRNEGRQPAPGGWTDRIYLSTDPLLSANDTKVFEHTINDSLAVDSELIVTAPIKLPSKAGTYYVLVQTDATLQVDEILEDNNLAFSNVINVTAEYNVTVTTNTELAVQGTSIPISGSATIADSGAPAANVEVLVYVTHEGGFVRKIKATTDAGGNFTTTFDPLAREAGDYIIAGAHPGAAVPAAQDAFTLIGVGVTPTENKHQITDGQSLTRQLQLTNLSDVDLTSLQFDVIGAPANLSVDVVPPSFAALEGRETEAFSYTIHVLNDTISIADFTLRVSTAEGATLDVPIAVTVIPRMGRIAVPDRIDEGMLRGRLTPIDIEITNEGGAATGPISVQLPAAPWLSGPATIPSLQPGETTKLALVLNPAADLPLGPYSGSLVLDPVNASAVSVPFTFTAASDATGGLAITVVDELTYYGENSPNVSGASVKLIDPFTNVVVGTGNTDANGLLTLDPIPEGNYELEVAAAGHHTSRSSIVIAPGAVKQLTAFVKTRLVTYDWNVEPVEFEDRTRVSIESTFVTNVPVPVLVVDPGVIDLAEVENGFQQIDFTIRNEGLIQATDIQLKFPSHPLWEIVPLIDKIDVLAAKSSVKIPVIIRRISFDGSAFPNDLLANDQGACSYTATIEWILLCGPFGIPYSVPVPILNAHGNCGSTYSGAGPGGRYTGGGGGGVGPSINSPIFNYNPPEECDCFKASLSISVPVPIPLKDFSIGPVAASVKANAKVEVKAETCCEEEDGATGLKFSGSGEVSGEIAFTYYLAGGEFSEEITSGGYKYKFEAIAGVPLEIKGAIAGSATVSKECDGALKACGEIKVSIGASVGPKIALTGSRTPIGGGLTEKFGGEAQLSLQTGVSGSIKKCIGEEAEGKLCFDGFKVVAEAKAFIGIEVITLGIEKFLADPACIPESTMTAGLDAMFADLLDPTTIANAYGSEDEFNEALGLIPITTSDPGVEMGVPHPGIPPAEQQVYASAGGVCAVVKLRLDQDVIMTRTAFEATLEVNNGATSAVENLQVFITVVDVASGKVVEDRFAISDAIASTFTSSPDSSDELPMWHLAGELSGSLVWTLLPTDLAAPDGPTEYTVGGLMTYQLNGETLNVPLFPAPITVYPDAALELKYFHQRDVYSDDPFTDEVEPAVPYDLGILVSNVGKGTANNLEIVSAQPKIIENEKGLLIDFQIIGAHINNVPQPGSLTITMGNILPDETRVGRWQLTSSLQGHFIDYEASFEHLTGFGDPRTSIIKKVEIYELIHTVRDARAGADNLYDFLTNEVDDELDLPDTVHLSDMSVHPVAAGSLTTVVKTPVLGDLTAEIQVAMPDAFGYLRIDDPGNGQYLLDRIERADGSVLPIDRNAWLTDRTFKVDGDRPIYENKLHLFDHSGSTSYRIFYRLDDQLAPQLLDVIDVTPDPRDAAVESVQVQFSESVDPASLSFEDLTLTRNEIAVPLDGSVTVTDLGDGQYRFDGLNAFTADAGVYRLTLDAAGVVDFANNAGIGRQSDTWTNGSAPAYVLSIDAGPDQRNVPLEQIDVAFSKPIDAASFDISDLGLTFNGEPIVTDALDIQTEDDQSFRISGLAALTGADGTYALTVNATGVEDSSSQSGLGSETVTWTLDRAAPQLIALEQPVTPRKIVVLDFEVTFDEPIDVATFTRADVSLTRDGGENLIDNQVSIQSLGDNTYLITGTNWNQGLEGNYELTVDGAGITDLAGNAGTNALTVSWTMDLSNPLAPSNFAISPDTGVSSNDGLTNNRQLTLTGSLAETGLLVRLYDDTLQKNLGDATVNGNAFAHTFTLGEGVTHRIRVRAVDAAGNLADAFYTIKVDVTAPILQLQTVNPNPRDTPLASLDLISNEPMNWSQLDIYDLSLSRNGGGNLVDDSFSFEVLSSTRVRISGLASVTDQAGAYVLSVGTGIADLAGNPPVVSAVAGWQNIDDQVAPSSNVVDGGTVTVPTFLVEWTGTDNVGGSGLAFFDVFVSVDDGPYQIWQIETPQTAAEFEGEFGRSYAFYSVATDHSGNVESAPDAADWTAVVPQGSARLGDLVWNDLNFNGVLDPNEPGIGGVQVNLYRDTAEGGELLGAAMTDADGAYSFSALNLDFEYFLSFDATQGFAFTVPNVGSDSTDSDVDSITGRTTSFTLLNGLNANWDAGLVATGSIAGDVWADVNGDAERQSGEAGLPGWTVYLDQNNNGSLDNSEPSQLTDSDGHYKFENLRPGTHVVAEVIEDGYVQTHPGPAGAFSSSDGKTQLSRSYTFTGTTGQTFTPGEVIDEPVSPAASQLVGIQDFQTDGRFAGVDGHGYTVVVIDTGIDVDHEFFGPDSDGDGIADRIVYQYDFADNDADATDVASHGSHVSSVIASQDTSYGGVAPGVGIIHLKVFGDDGRGYFGDVEEALQWVIENSQTYKIAAVNLSIGDGLNWTQSRRLHGIDDELSALAALNVISVAAAGNAYGVTGISGLAYPAADPNTISVGAVWDADRGGPHAFGDNGTDYTTEADRITSFSQRHPDLLDVVAPGALITAANAYGGVSTMRGTSMATPFVTGAAVLAQQIANDQLGRSLSPHEFRYLLDISGAIVIDGDDEDDNVPNTGAAFMRLDLVALGEAVMAYDGSQAGGPNDVSEQGGNGGLGIAAGGAFRYTIDLAPGQDRTGVSFGNQSEDADGPQLTDVIDVTPDPRRNSIDTVDVVFDEEIDLATFDVSDVTLTHNTDTVLLDDSVTTSLVSGTTYRISGLGSFTTGEGSYTLSVSSSQIKDLAGNDGTNSAADSWVTDSTGPTSHVDSLPQRQASLLFPVTVTGSDPSFGGVNSGVDSYEIYRLVNGAAWELWRTVSASDPTAMYTAESAQSIGFYSIAIDAAGNRQVKSPVIEASTYVPDLDAPITQVDTVDADQPTFEVSFSGVDSGGTGLQAFNVFVSVDDAAPVSLGTVNAGTPDASGVYHSSLSYHAIADGTAHSYRFFTVGVDGDDNTEASPVAPADVALAANFDIPTSLEVIAFDVERGATQRSFIQYLDVTFNDTGFSDLIDSINDTGTTNDRIKLLRFGLDGSGPGEEVDLAGRVANVDQVMKIDFGANGIGGNRNSAVGNGYYRLQIDIDGDGTADSDLAFYRLFGDANGDRTVNNADISAIMTEYGQTGHLDGDINGDGVVNNLDRMFAAQNRGPSIAADLKLDD